MIRVHGRLNGRAKMEQTVLQGRKNPMCGKHTIRKVLALLAALLALSAAVGVAGEDRGTGGTQPRTRYFTGEHRGARNRWDEWDGDWENDWDTDWDDDAGKKSTLDGLGQLFLDQWMDAYGAYRDWDGWFYVTDELFSVCDGYQDKDFPDDAFYLAGPYTRVYDVNSGRALTLPEVFYDGFDFTDYINTYLTLLPGETSINGYYSSNPPGINNTGRPFTLALDASTPFTILPNHNGQAYVQIVSPEFYYMDEDEDEVYSWMEYILFVPLTHDISPWGGCIVNMQYQETESPSGIRLKKPALRIDGGTALTAEEKINTSLDAMLPEVYQALDAALPGFQHLYDDPDASPGWIQAFPHITDHYVAVSYHLMYFDYDIGEFDRLALLAGAIFDLHTGDRIADIPNLAGNVLDRADTIFGRYDYYTESFFRATSERNELMNHLTPGSMPKFSDLTAWDGELWASFDIRPNDLDYYDPGFFSRVMVPLGIPAW